jgi:hypothetical protein
MIKQQKFLLYSFVAAFLVGFHIFSFKYIDYLLKNNVVKSSKHRIFEFSITIFISLCAFLLSRYFIFRGMQNTDHPVLVHIILNTSVFVTLLLSFMLLGSKLCIYRLMIGTILTLLGLYIVQTSVQSK